MHRSQLLLVQIFMVMAFIVELATEQLSVRAIHRLIAGLPEDFDVIVKTLQQGMTSTTR